LKSTRQITGDRQRHHAKFLQSAGTLPDDYVFAIIPSEPLGNVSRRPQLCKSLPGSLRRTFLAGRHAKLRQHQFPDRRHQKANSLEPRAIIDALHALEIPGVSGTLAFDARGRRRNPVYTLYTVRQQQWEAIKFFKIRAERPRMQLAGRRCAFR